MLKTSTSYYLLLLSLFIIACSSNDDSLMNPVDDDMMEDTDSLNFVLDEQMVTFNVCAEFYCGIGQLAFLTDTIGYAVSGVDVYKTVNAGADWDILINQDITGKLIPLSENELFLNTYDGILHTTNGGDSWENIERPLEFICPENSFINPGIIEFVNNTHGFVQDICYKGDLYATRDRGANWDLIYTNTDPISLYHFANTQDGFVVVNDRIYLTRDAGTSWNETVVLPSTFDYVLKGETQFIFPEGSDNVMFPDAVTATNQVWLYDVNALGDIAVVLYDETLQTNNWQLVLYVNDTGEWLFVDQLNDLERANSLYSSITISPSKTIYISASFIGVISKYYLE